MDQFEIIASSCPNGDCPTIFRNRTTGQIRVRGANPDFPATSNEPERDVDFDPAVFAGLVAQLP